MERQERSFGPRTTMRVLHEFNAKLNAQNIAYKGDVCSLGARRIVVTCGSIHVFRGGSSCGHGIMRPSLRARVFDIRRALRFTCKTDRLGCRVHALHDGARANDLAIHHLTRGAPAPSPKRVRWARCCLQRLSRQIRRVANAES